MGFPCLELTPRSRDNYFKVVFLSLRFRASHFRSSFICPRSGGSHSDIGKTCLRFGGHFCTGGRNVPQIWGRLMHGGQKHALDSGQIYARGAETCLRFGAGICHPCNVLSRILGSSFYIVEGHIGECDLTGELKYYLNYAIHLEHDIIMTAAKLHKFLGFCHMHTAQCSFKLST